jgi:hypothetical protein
VVVGVRKKLRGCNFFTWPREFRCPTVTVICGPWMVTTEFVVFFGLLKDGWFSRIGFGHYVSDRVLTDILLRIGVFVKLVGHVNGKRVLNRVIPGPVVSYPVSRVHNAINFISSNFNAVTEY